MNDFKELIDKLRESEAHMGRFGIFARAVRREEIKAVADAIEQLVRERDELYMEVMDCTKKIGCKAIEQVKKERDAAYEALNRLWECSTCGHYHECGYDDIECVACEDGSEYVFGGVKE